MEFDIYNLSCDVADPVAQRTLLLKSSTKVGQMLSIKKSGRGTKSCNCISPCSFGGCLPGTKSCRGFLAGTKSCTMHGQNLACVCKISTSRRWKGQNLACLLACIECISVFGVATLERCQSSVSMAQWKVMFMNLCAVLLGTWVDFRVVTSKAFQWSRKQQFCA